MLVDDHPRIPLKFRLRERIVNETRLKFCFESMNTISVAIPVITGIVICGDDDTLNS